MSKVIIEAAINGNATKAQNPHLPYTPEEIAKDSIAACQAGAALILSMSVSLIAPGCKR